MKNLRGASFPTGQGNLLIGVSGIDAEGKRDAVTIHEKPHLHDRVGAVLLAVSILAQPIIFVSLLDFKIVVRTVIVNDAGIPFGYLQGVLVKLGLYVIHFFIHDRKGPVNLVQFEVRLFDEL